MATVEIQMREARCLHHEGLYGDQYFLEETHPTEVGATSLVFVCLCFLFRDTSAVCDLPFAAFRMFYLFTVPSGAT